MSGLINKACNVLILLRDEEMTCRELADRVREPKNSVHGILADLVDRGLVVRDRPKMVFGMGSPPYKYRVAPEWIGEKK